MFLLCDYTKNKERKENGLKHIAECDIICQSDKGGKSVKKGICLVFLALLLMIAPNCINADEAIKVEIDGKQVAYTKEAGTPFVDGTGRTQVPFRQTMETYGCTVSWNEAGQTAIAEKDGMTVEVPIGQPYIYRNGAKVQNDTAALIQNGRTYLPIRVVLESFGADVRWNGDVGTVVVTSGGMHVGKPSVKVHFLDVGQGDATLIDDGVFEILIDAGVAAEGSKVVDYLADYVDGALDVVVASHEDADHIGGLPAVFDTYAVDKVVDNGRNGSTKTYITYHRKVEAEGADYAVDTNARTIMLPSGAALDFLPIATVYDNANDNSVATLLTYGDVEVLLTGDLSADVADNNNSMFADVDVLKAGHHGSRTSVSSLFLQTTKPEYVIISAGLDNSYGHPHKEALSAFLGAGADIYGTFRSGDIVMTTNGKQISFDTSEKLTLLDAGAKSNGSVSAQEPIQQPQQPSQPITEITVTYIGNRNSKVFHRATCTSVSQMKDTNKVIWNSRDEAVSQGYSPCRNCQP